MYFYSAGQVSVAERVIFLVSSGPTCGIVPVPKLNMTRYITSNNSFSCTSFALRPNPVGIFSIEDSKKKSSKKKTSSKKLFSSHFRHVFF